MDAKRRALLASAGLMAFGNFKIPDDTVFIQVPDTRSVPELFADGNRQIFNGICCARCVYRFGTHKFCVTHCKDEKCERFKLDK